MAKYVKADGSIADVTPTDGREFSLYELQKFVGGYIEIVNTSQREIVLIVNEDGYAMKLPVNKIATSMYREIGGTTDVVGDVLVTTHREIGD